MCCVHSIAETAVIWKWTMTTIMTGRVAVRIKAAGCHRAQKPVPPFSGKKLTVTTRVLAKITNSFIGRKEEAGGILGASKSLDIVDNNYNVDSSFSSNTDKLWRKRFCLWMVYPQRTRKTTRSTDSWTGR